MVDRIVNAGQSRTLRALIFETKTTNPFPTAFSTIFIAIHELSFRDNLLLADDGGAHKVTKVLESICAVANIGRGAPGMVFVGVADTEADAKRVMKLDGVEARQVGNRWVVGIDREAHVLKESHGKYYQRWRDAIDGADLSQGLKSDILSNLDMCEFEGMHLILITVPPQKSVSLYNGKVFTRDGDQTVEATPEKIVGISARFAG